MIYIILGMVVIAALAFGYLKYFRIKADVVMAPTYIYSQSSMTYQNATGNSYAENSKTLKIRKVTLFQITAPSAWHIN